MRGYEMCHSIASVQSGLSEDGPLQLVRKYPSITFQHGEIRNESFEIVVPRDRRLRSEKSVIQSVTITNTSAGNNPEWMRANRSMKP